ncbi:MAG: hypothetical protein ACM3ZE_30395 [Myxococcales bacterium]
MKEQIVMSAMPALGQLGEEERAGDPAKGTAKETAKEATKVLRIADVARPQPSPSFAGLAAGLVAGLDGQGGAITLRFGDVEATASLHASVDPVVVRRAFERGEFVIAQQQPEGWLVLGVLRTSATPGLDIGDEYLIEARRVTLRAEHELLLTTGVARIAVAAVGRIESIARHITSRASMVQKIIGRVIQLN